MPHLVQMQEKWKKDGLVVVTVNTFNDEAAAKEKYLAEARKILRDNKVGLVNLFLDEDETVLETKLRIIAFPAIYVFDRQGRWTALNGIDEGAYKEENEIQQFVGKLLKERASK